ncbi:Hypothetical protein Minf_1462 [Methylacidiphilum infernorum V4]|uniref:Uncharacterized protein n=1 Tax=Methylacidiphilum infernorum (isolate V4) TaxID=481448 RepID=B3DW13_METI4|nr:Hypothetical protein Minf_1462 [Methylacidiphilum infernorum V4]
MILLFSHFLSFYMNRLHCASLRMQEKIRRNIFAFSFSFLIKDKMISQSKKRIFHQCLGKNNRQRETRTLRPPINVFLSIFSLIFSFLALYSSA